MSDDSDDAAKTAIYDPDRRRPRSEPIRVVSMKEKSEPIRRPEVQHQVKLRAIAEVAKPPPSPHLGRLAPPRDGRAARARQRRLNLIWIAGGLVLAAAIAVVTFLVAGR